MAELVKQMYPNMTPKEIQEMLRDPIQYNILDSLFNQSAPVDSVKKDSVVVPPVVPAVVPPVQQGPVTGGKAPVIKIKGVTTNYHPDDTTGSYLWPKKTGGQLNEYANGGGSFQQVIPETAIQNTEDFDVIMPNKRFGSFDVQKYDPNLGYYTVTNPNTGLQEAMDIDNFITRHNELLGGYDNGGVDKWKTDVLSRNDGTRRKAAKWFQTKYNEWRKANGLPEYFIDRGPHKIDSKLGIYTWSAPGIRKKKKEEKPKVDEKPKVEDKPEEDIDIDEGLGFQDVPGFKSPKAYGLGEWFPSDIAAMSAAAGMRIPDYKAYYGLPNASLMSPVYRNENYEPISAVTQTVQELGVGPEARGSALGVSGKGLKAAADIQQQTEALNTDQFLKTQAANNQVLNQFALLAEKEKSDYMNGLNAIAKENALNQNAKSAGFASAFGKGYNNVLNQMLINAEYPYQFQTPYGITVNPTLKSIYDDPLTGGSSSNYQDVFDYYYKMYSGSDFSLSKKEAVDAANTAARNHLNSIYQRNRRTGTGGATLSPFEQ